MTRITEIRKFWIDESKNCEDIELLKITGWSDVNYLIAKIDGFENKLKNREKFIKQLEGDLSCHIGIVGSKDKRIEELEVEVSKRTDKIFEDGLEIEGLQSEIIRLKEIIETTSYIIDNLHKLIEPQKHSCIDNEFNQIKECLNA